MVPSHPPPPLLVCNYLSNVKHLYCKLQTNRSKDKHRLSLEEALGWTQAWPCYTVSNHGFIHIWKKKKATSKLPPASSPCTLLLMFGRCGYKHINLWYSLARKLSLVVQDFLHGQMELTKKGTMAIFMFICTKSFYFMWVNVFNKMIGRHVFKLV